MLILLRYYLLCDRIAHNSSLVPESKYISQTIDLIAWINLKFRTRILLCLQFLAFFRLIQLFCTAEHPFWIWEAYKRNGVLQNLSLKFKIYRDVKSSLGAISGYVC